MPLEFRQLLASHPKLILKTLQDRDLLYLQNETGLPLQELDISNRLDKEIPPLKLMKQMNIDKLIISFLDKILNTLGRKMVDLPLHQRLKLLENVPDEVFFELSEKINHGINNIKFSDAPAVKILLDPEKGIDLSTAPVKFAEFFKILMEKYPDKFSLEVKRKIFLALLKLPKETTEVEKLSVVLQHTGPVMQKLFQLFGKNVKSPLVAEVMERLKSDIVPFPSEKAKEIIERSYGLTIDELFSQFNDRPIAAASVGQVHLAKLKYDDMEVVVKIRRPGIEEKAKRELLIMEELAPNEGIRKIVKHLRDTIEEELDFRIESKNLKKGKVYRQKKRGIYAVNEIKALPAKKEVLIMERAEGKNFNKFTTKSEVVKKLKGAANLLEFWLKETFLYGGFFHADLHSGNIFFKTTGRWPGHLLTLIDFGSVEKLTFQEKKALINLSLGAIFQSPQTVLESFLLFEKISPETQTVFLNRIKEVLQRNDQEVSWKTNEIINIALELEFNFPKSFTQFNRGKLFLEKHIGEITAELDKVDPLKKIKRITSEQILVKVMIRGLAGDLGQYFFHIGRGRGLIDKKTISRILREYLKPMLRQKIRAFFHPRSKKDCLKLESHMSKLELTEKEIEEEILSEMAFVYQ